MAGYRSSSLFECLWTEMNINLKKKGTWPLPNHLDRTSLVNKGLIILLSGKFFSWDTVGKMAPSCLLG